MAIGKNKKLGKKKGQKRKIVDPFSRKEWYDVRAPTYFSKPAAGKTPVNKTQGTRNAVDGLRGRVFELSLGDLKDKAEEESYRKFQLKVEEVQGRTCLTNFYGMEITRDKLISVIRKWQSLIEAHVDVKTADGYALRFFLIGFTKRRPNQTSKFTYAQSAQIRNIRKKMVEVVNKETAGLELKDIVQKLIADTFGKEIERVTQSIFPLQNCLVRKVKLLHAPKTDMAKLMELHGGAQAVADLGSKVDRVEEAPVAAPATEEKPKEATA